MDSVKIWMAQTLLSALLTQLDSKLIKGFIDAGLDKVEDMIAESETKVDDVALPLLARIREIFDVPDND